MPITAQPGPNCSPQWVAITPHDSTDFTAGPCRAVYVGGTGNIVAVDQDGNTATFVGVPVGSILPIMAKRINATNTSATYLVAMY